MLCMHVSGGQARIQPMWNNINCSHVDITFKLNRLAGWKVTRQFSFPSAGSEPHFANLKYLSFFPPRPQPVQTSSLFRSFFDKSWSCSRVRRWRRRRSGRRRSRGEKHFFSEIFYSARMRPRIKCLPLNLFAVPPKKMLIWPAKTAFNWNAFCTI